MSQITIILNGQATQIEEGTTGTTLFESQGEIVALKINGEPRDLYIAPKDGDEVEGITLASEDGLNILRHSTAHVLAQAVQKRDPNAKLGIGPFITDGFYYDFDVAAAFTPEDLKAIEKDMQRIVKEGQRFQRRDITDDAAREEEANEPYKMELIGLKSKAADAAEGASVEVGEGGLTMYDNVNRKGEVVWTDLCRGPHLPSTKLIGNGFALTRSAAAYWRGSEKNPMLQRIYGTAWATKEDLKAYQFRIEEALKRDHRKLGAELDLFSFHEKVGAGLPLFHPKGGVVKREMENYVRQAHIDNGFQYVGTPHIAKEDLFYTSGHLPYYAEAMFPPMSDGEGEITYRLKAMNCPMHNLIFASRGRSYRELPLRFFEFGTVYRDEKSGVLQGLTRVRSITQDDSHSYVTKEGAADEVRHLINFVLGVLRDFGLNDFYLELSTRDEDGEKKDKFIGSDEDWADATAILKRVAEESGLETVPDPGGAAYYGPKISIQARDAIGRTWQMSTIQYDFNQPERFELEYTAPDGSHQRPVMIHSAKFGSIERFMGVLIEHYAGAFPVWLAPVQVVGIPVAGEFVPYLEEVAAKLREHGVRVEVDSSDDRMQKKIRTHTKEKVPYLLIAGSEDQEKGAVSFRMRDGRQDNGIPVDEAVARIVDAIRTKAQV